MRNVIDAIIEYEAETFTDEETIEFLQELINNGSISSLQGHYGRIDWELIEAGYCTRPA